jgi:hypothetical protein
MQRIVITTDSTIALLPLVQSAIQRELQILTLGLQRTRERIQAFERQFELSSAEFECKFNAGEMGDTLEVIEWAGELRTFKLLDAQRQALQNIQLN